MSPVVRRAIFLCLTLMVLSGSAYILRGPQGLSSLADKRQEIKNLQEQNAELEQENQRTRERITALQTSQAEQELEIREKTKLLRKGETTFILPDDKK